MSRGKAERLLNLHIMLLGSRRFVSKEAIRRAHYGDYPHSEQGDAAFERAFERDKDDLRSIGAVIEVGSDDPYFDDEVGYRIPAERNALPEVRFEADEASVLGLAAQVWQHETLAKATGDALTKLSAVGVDLDHERLDVVPPAVRATEPAFEGFWEAIQARKVTRFAYRRPSEPQPTDRRIEPWGLVRSSGRWYVVGHDLDRKAERVFRLSRVEGAVRTSGKGWAYEIPEGVDVRELAKRLLPDSPAVDVELFVRARRGAALRRQAAEVVPAPNAPDTPAGEWDLVRLQLREPQAVDQVLRHGPDVVVRSPDTLRDAVLSRLTRALEGLA